MKCQDFYKVASKVKFKETNRESELQKCLKAIETAIQSKGWVSCTHTCTKIDYVINGVVSDPRFANFFEKNKTLLELDSSVQPDVAFCTMCLRNFFEILKFASGGTIDLFDFKDLELRSVSNLTTLSSLSKLQFDLGNGLYIYDPNTVRLEQKEEEDANDEDPLRLKESSVKTIVALALIEENEQNRQRRNQLVSQIVPNYNKQKPTAIKDLVSGAAKYFVLIPQPAAEPFAAGDNPGLPEYVAPYRLALGDVLDAAQAMQSEDKKTSKQPDRTLDFLLCCGAHGGVGTLFESKYTTDILNQNVVTPLLQSGVKARIIVLDACLTASVAPAFIPLLTSDGVMYCTMYTTSQRIADDENWGTVLSQLGAPNTIANTFLKKMREGAGVLMQEVFKRPIKSGFDESEIEELITRRSAKKEFISVVRYLPQMIDLMKDIDRHVEARGLNFTQLLNKVQKLLSDWGTRVGDSERKILTQMRDVMKEADMKEIRAQLRARSEEILGQDKYGVKKKNLSNLKFYGRDSIQTLLVYNESVKKILANANLPLCGTQFAIYEKNGNRLRYDKHLTDKNSYSFKLLEGYEESVGTDLYGGTDPFMRQVKGVLDYLSGVNLTPESDFLK